MELQKFFISYSHKNSEEERLARFFHSEFILAGYESFLDVGISSGLKWGREVQQYMRWCDYCVLLFSEQAIGSERMQSQIRMAMHEQQTTGSPRLFPIRIRYAASLDYGLDSCVGHLHSLTWGNPQDSKQILNDILHVVDTDSPTETQDVYGPVDWLKRDQKPFAVLDFRQPLASFDPRAAYVPEGTLVHHDPYYIRREADEQLEKLAARTGQTVLLEGPRQTGKTSLLFRYLVNCQQAGKNILLIDSAIFSNSDLETESVFLSNLAAMIGHVLNIEQAPPPEFFSQPAMTHFMEDRVLPSLDSPLVLAFDNIDALYGRDYQQEFFSMLRRWHTHRENIALAWDQVDIALVTSLDSRLLLRNPDQSPFAVSHHIEAHPFTLEQCHAVNQTYENPLLTPQVEQLWEWLQGHPYLTRLAYYQVSCQDKLDLPTLLDTSLDERKTFGDHLQAQLLTLLTYPELLDAMKHVMYDEPVADQTLYFRLYALGLIREENQTILPASPFYANYFRSLM